MFVHELRLRDFRGYHAAHVVLGEELTVVHGPNGAGKTNLLEGLYFGCTGRSCRTANEREVVRFGAAGTRIVVNTEGEDGPHEQSVGFAPGESKRMLVDGARVERLLDAPTRPLVSVFAPDRLELVNGAPAVRRAHLDQFVAALWPARASTRRAYAQALAQRNALIARIRAGRGTRDALHAWDGQLARHGVQLMGDRARAVSELSAPFQSFGVAIGCDGDFSVSYRPRSGAVEPQQLAAELAERVETDLERGYTGYGPHRDDLVISRDSRNLRAYGSQGERRVALLALLLAERDRLAASRPTPPVMLLDDVMSELDQNRREALIAVLRDGRGQSVITTTDLDHVPGAHDPGVTRLEVSGGRVLEASAA
jgi:DNA replication and repair protein RecF